MKFGETTTELSKTVKDGDIVKVDYIGICEGKVFDTSLKDEAEKNEIYSEDRIYEPFEFRIGDGKMMKGFEEAVMGMMVGDEKVVTIQPHKAYGDYMQDRIKTLPRSILEKQGIDVELGSNLIIKTKHGILRAHVIELAEDGVTLDLNPELAGKSLTFNIFLRDINA